MRRFLLKNDFFSSSVLCPYCWQLLIQLLRLDYCTFPMSVNDEPSRVSHAFTKKNMVRYIRLLGRFSRCIVTLAVHETPFWPVVSK